MFAGLLSTAADAAALVSLGREFSPRVAVHADGLVMLDVAGLRRLLGEPHSIGEELRQAAAARGLHPHVALAATRVAAAALAIARPGLAVVPPGQERAWLAPVPIHVLAPLVAAFGGPPAEASAVSSDLIFRRWGLKTFGELAALPPAALSARLGQDGVAWQRLARGEDPAPLVPDIEEEPFEESLDLDWPVEGLEPLSFVLGRLFEALSDRLERGDRGVAVLHVRLRLVTRETYARSLQLPAPMRDPRVLRTLALLDLESHPAPAGIDRVTIAADTVPGRIVQWSLLTRAMPFPEQISTLMARLLALVGDGRAGAPVLVDSHRPGAFEVAPFTVTDSAAPRRPCVQVADRAPVPGSTWHRVGETATAPFTVVAGGSGSAAGTAQGIGPAIRRFRLPVPARVALCDGRPERVVTDRRGLTGGRVEAAAGPWRTSGEWWRVPDARVQQALDGAHAQVGWDRDEWDVALADGGIYRLYRDRRRDRWFVDGIID